MHSKIFQVSKGPIKRSQFIDADTVADNTDWVDYADEESEERRIKLVQELINSALPHGMFQIIDDGCTLIYQDGLDKWKEDYVKKIHQAAAAITPANVLTWCSEKKELSDLLKRPIGGYTMFVIEDNYCAEFSNEFMEFIKDIKPGDKIYVGAVLDYHW